VAEWVPCGLAWIPSITAHSMFRDRRKGQKLHRRSGRLGYAQRWNPRTTLNGADCGGQLHPWYVGMPGMSSFLRPLNGDLWIHTGQKVYTFEGRDTG
jgi:predicted NAD/FAD-dependent oxidoreductase